MVDVRRHTVRGVSARGGGEKDMSLDLAYEGLPIELFSLTCREKKNVWPALCRRSGNRIIQLEVSRECRAHFASRPSYLCSGITVIFFTKASV